MRRTTRWKLSRKSIIKTSLIAALISLGVELYFLQPVPSISNIIIILGVISSTLLCLVIIDGYRYKWQWTGLSKKTLWDWMQLLIIPIVLAIGAFALNQLQS